MSASRSTQFVIRTWFRFPVCLRTSLRVWCKMSLYIQIEFPWPNKFACGSHTIVNTASHIWKSEHIAELCDKGLADAHTLEHVRICRKYFSESKHFTAWMCSNKHWRLHTCDFCMCFLCARCLLPAPSLSSGRHAVLFWAMPFCT